MSDNQHPKGIHNIHHQLSLKTEPLDSSVVNSYMTKMCTSIGKLPHEHIEMIFLLIAYHAHLNQDVSDVNTIPYQGKPMGGGKGLIYKLTSLPSDLQKIVYVYLNQISS